jgi:hypothetical protein
MRVATAMNPMQSTLTVSIITHHENKIEQQNRYNKRRHPIMDSSQDSMQEDMEESMIEDMEEKLEQLEEFDNQTQLELLHHEIEHILMHGEQPNEAWYQKRINHIQAYQSIDWKDLATRSYQHDSKIYEASVHIIDHLEQLEVEWSAYPTFNLYIYQRLLEMIRSVWKYYSHEYCVTDVTNTVDILDLMNSMDNI